MITLKYNNIFIASITTLLILVSSYSSYSKNPYQNSILHKSAEGYIGFNLHIDTSIFNGYNDTSLSQTLFEIQDIGKCELLRDYGSVIISFTWNTEITHKGFFIFLNELTGSNDYFIQFTWDYSLGKSDLYVNGIPLRTEDEKYYYPWKSIEYSNSNFKITEIHENISGLEITNNYVISNEIISKVPLNLIGKNYDTFLCKINSSSDIEQQKGKLLYSSDFTGEADINNWILEGPGKITIQDNQMIMKSEIPNPSDGFTGHFNFWCPINFPDSIIIEWEFTPISDHGVCHLFFATKGQNGKEMFDSSLAKRDGHYSQYHSRDLNNYFVIYFSNWGILRTTNFATTSLHKSNPYAFLSHGKIGIVPGDNHFHKIQLIKKQGEIQLYVNGNICLDFSDPGNNRWGTINSNGKIGFRQMAETIAKYKNFKVYSIKK